MFGSVKRFGAFIDRHEILLSSNLITQWGQNENDSACFVMIMRWGRGMRI